jgi:hypothetical protein
MKLLASSTFAAVKKYRVALRLASALAGIWK